MVDSDHSNESLDGTPRKRIKRRNKDNSITSQPTILKWVQQVAGPLQDIIKQQANDQEANNANGSDANSIAVHIQTVFDTGAWVEMHNFLGIHTENGQLYGGVRISSLKFPLSSVVEEDNSISKVPQLQLLIKARKYVDDEMTATFHDPTGEIEGFFHRDIIEQIGPALIIGVGVLLRDVSIFMPIDNAIGNSGKKYLNIVPRNLHQVFLSKTSAHQTIIAAYNKQQLEVVSRESGENHNQESVALFAQASERNIRNTSHELNVMSQRQVVYRHPPAIVDTSDHNRSSNVTTTQLSSSNWQWSNLLRSKPDNSNEVADNSSRSEGDCRGNNSQSLLGGHSIPEKGPTMNSLPTVLESESAPNTQSTIIVHGIDEESDDDW